MSKPYKPRCIFHRNINTHLRFKDHCIESSYFTPNPKINIVTFDSLPDNLPKGDTVVTHELLYEAETFSNASIKDSITFHLSFENKHVNQSKTHAEFALNHYFSCFATIHIHLHIHRPFCVHEDKSPAYTFRATLGDPLPKGFSTKRTQFFYVSTLVSQAVTVTIYSHVHLCNSIVTED